VPRAIAMRVDNDVRLAVRKIGGGRLFKDPHVYEKVGRSTQPDPDAVADKKEDGRTDVGKRYNSYRRF
jgi:hypothetical protein